MFLLGSTASSFYFLNQKSLNQKMHSWIYRDDIGAPHGIHGYEEQVNSVGQHHGHFHWTHEGFMSTFDSASVRRGFKVWLKCCQSCHGAYKQKYDIMVDKVFLQTELIKKMKDAPPIHPGHQMRRGYYFLEWDYRQRLIHDRIWSTYMTRDHAKSANAGLWPKDLSRTAEHNPAHAGYIYNILTGYHYLPPFGLEVPEGRYFNPYHHHMIVGMARVRIFLDNLKSFFSSLNKKKLIFKTDLIFNLLSNYTMVCLNTMMVLQLLLLKWLTIFLLS